MGGFSTARTIGPNRQLEDLDFGFGAVDSLARTPVSSLVRHIFEWRACIGSHDRKSGHVLGLVAVGQPVSAAGVLQGCSYRQAERNTAAWIAFVI